MANLYPKYMDFKSALKYLENRLSYENLDRIVYDNKNFNLERLRHCLKCLGISYQKLKCLHIAGSKGKGTVANLIAKYLSVIGYKVGLYTSPHLFDVRERICINGRKISRAKFVSYVSESGSLLEAHNLTYFEILTVMALKFFVEQKVDYAVLEVGLGGRLDATNIVKPLISVLTKVEREHSDILGGSLEKILQEKLGIMKRGVPFFIAKQSDVVMAILKKKMAVSSDFALAVFLQENDLVQRFLRINFKARDSAFLENAEIAYFVLKFISEKAGKKFDEKKFFEILLDFRLCGHLEVKKMNEHMVVFDVAHTVSSFENLINFLRKKFRDKKFVFLIALMKDKDASGILKVLGKIASKIVFTKVHKIRGQQPSFLLNLARQMGCAAGTFKSLKKADDASLAYKNLLSKLAKNEVLVVAGSNYLLAKIMAKIRH